MAIIGLTRNYQKHAEFLEEVENLIDEYTIVK